MILPAVPGLEFGDVVDPLAEEIANPVAARDSVPAV